MLLTCRSVDLSVQVLRISSHVWAIRIVATVRLATSCKHDRFLWSLVLARGRSFTAVNGESCLQFGSWLSCTVGRSRVYD